MENGGYAFLGNTLDGLSSGYLLVDAFGDVLLPQSSAGGEFYFAENEQGGTYYRRDGYVIFPVDSYPKLYFVVRDEGGFSVDVGLMACAYIKAALAPSGRTTDRNENLRRILLGGADPRELRVLAEQLGLDDDRERFCIVLRERGGVAAFAETVEQVFSQGSADVVLMMDRNTMCLIIGRAGDIGVRDGAELAAAIEETAMEMGFGKLQIGVGEPRRSLGRLHESYAEAQRAIEMGAMYSLKGSVFVFRNMLLERLLSDIPEELCRQCYQTLFGKRNARLFNEEMQYTIKMFMESNLNLSEAARLIYIHRNTLVYRLDKIQAATGLDLRKFDDAATFKFIMLLGSRLGLNKGGEIKPE